MPAAQVHPWCISLLGSARICHFRSNMGTDWAYNVLPDMPNLGALPTDILVPFCTLLCAEPCAI